MATNRPFSQDFSGDSKTQQHFQQSADVNNIINHYVATGIDPHADRLKNQRFGYATSKTFEEAMRQTAEIQSAFEHLPAQERSSFENNPALWLDSLVETPTPHIDEPSIVDPAASDAVVPPAEIPETTELDST